jgi:hypothetical protein
MVGPGMTPHAHLGRHRALTEAINEQIDSLSVTVSNADRSVRVQVDGWGALTGLWLHERAYRHGADALAVQIVEVARAAAELVADRQAHLLTEFGRRARRIRHSG